MLIRGPTPATTFSIVSARARYMLYRILTATWSELEAMNSHGLAGSGNYRPAAQFSNYKTTVYFPTNEEPFSRRRKRRPL